MPLQESDWLSNNFLQAMDDRLKSVEQFHLSSTTPSSSASSEGSVQKTKRKVPAKVAVSIYLPCCSHILKELVESPSLLIF